jgi:hypothetical protein
MAVNVEERFSFRCTFHAALEPERFEFDNAFVAGSFLASNRGGVGSTVVFF